MPLLGWLLRPGRLILLALLVAAIVAGIAYGSWIHSQLRAIGVITTAYETPVLSWATRKVTKEPTLADTSIAGVPATVARPGGDGPWPTILLLNGATEAGRRDADVVRVALGLARVGYLVAIPDTPSLLAGDATVDVLDRTLAVSRALASRQGTRDGRLGIVGLGLGGTFGLLVAQDSQLAPRISTVVAITPVTDLVELGRLATTGYTRVQNGYAKRPVPRELRASVIDAIVQTLPDDPASRLVRQALANAGNDPLAALDRVPLDLLDDDTAAVVALLRNDDPRRYDRLYAALPPEIRSTVERLSPLEGASRLRAPVEIATAADDPYVPLAQARALERASDAVRVTVADAFSSTGGAPSLDDAGAFFAIDGLIVRALKNAAR
ncbi:MAG: hypothetical protein R3C15_04975 [Thermoleophilia bacterium]